MSIPAEDLLIPATDSAKEAVREQTVISAAIATSGREIHSQVSLEPRPT